MGGRRISTGVDHLGTPQRAWDDSAELAWAADYEAFGKAWEHVPGSTVPPSIEVNLRFPGQYLDRETGLHYNGARYYDGNTGRYITPDPLGVQSDSSLYTYAGNNPLRWTDPSGLLKFSMGDLEASAGGCCNQPNWVDGIAELQRFLSTTEQGQSCRSKFYGRFGVDPLAELVYGRGPNVEFYDDPGGNLGRYDPCEDELEMNTDGLCGANQAPAWKIGQVIWHELIHLHEGFWAAHLPPEHTAAFDSLDGCIGRLY